MDNIIPLNADLDVNLNELEAEVSRIKLLVDTCVHLFPETDFDLDYEEELLTVLGVAQTLLHNLERRIKVKRSPSGGILGDPREDIWT